MKKKTAPKNRRGPVPTPPPPKRLTRRGAAAALCARGAAAPAQRRPRSARGAGLAGGRCFPGIGGGRGGDGGVGGGGVCGGLGGVCGGLGGGGCAAGWGGCFYPSRVKPMRKGWNPQKEHAPVGVFFGPKRKLHLLFRAQRNLPARGPDEKKKERAGSGWVPICAEDQTFDGLTTESPRPSVCSHEVCPLLGGTLSGVGFKGKPKGNQPQLPK